MAFIAINLLYIHGMDVQIPKLQHSLAQTKKIINKKHFRAQPPPTVLFVIVVSCSFVWTLRHHCQTNSFKTIGAGRAAQLAP